MTSLSELAAIWQEAKEAESRAVQARRECEDKMASLIGIPETLEGTETAQAPGGWTIKVVGRINRAVNGDMLQEIAAEHGLTDHLPHLFRWKAELNMGAWKAAAPEITRPLADAITAKPGRPSFTITKEV